MYNIFLLLFLVFFTPVFSENVSYEKALGIDVFGREFICKREQDNIRFTACQNAWNRQSIAPCETLIPKKIHFVWLSDLVLPNKNLGYVQTFKEKHPNFEIKIWTKSDLSRFPKEFQVLIEERSTLQEKEDILRCALLLEYGGFVVDVEHECLRPLNNHLDDLCHRSSFIGSLELPLAKRKFKRRLHYATTFIGASKAHPIIKMWFAEIVEAYTTKTHADKSIAKSLKKEKYRAWTPYLLFAQVVDDALVQNTSDALILPPTYVFPIRACWIKAYEKQNKKNILENIVAYFQTNSEPFSQIAPETVCVHHKGGSWQK